MYHWYFYLKVLDTADTVHKDSVLDYSFTVSTSETREFEQGRHTDEIKSSPQATLVRVLLLYLPASDLSSSGLTLSMHLVVRSRRVSRAPW